jgi:hypothetical protein
MRNPTQPQLVLFAGSGYGEIDENLTYQKWDWVRSVHAGGAAAKSTEMVAVGGPAAAL